MEDFKQACPRIMFAFVENHRVGSERRWAVGKGDLWKNKDEDQLESEFKVDRVGTRVMATEMPH